MWSVNLLRSKRELAIAARRDRSKSSGALSRSLPSTLVRCHFSKPLRPGTKQHKKAFLSLCVRLETVHFRSRREINYIHSATTGYPTTTFLFNKCEEGESFDISTSDKDEREWGGGTVFFFTQSTSRFSAFCSVFLLRRYVYPPSK